jgi:four helix bundle protein
MDELENFRKLKVWQKARIFTVKIYKVTDSFPKQEQYGLTSQIRRASVSIIANIAEGTKRKTVKDRKHFLVMSDTSLEEVKCYLILCYDLKYLNEEQGKELMTDAREIGRMLNGFANSIK